MKDPMGGRMGRTSNKDQVQKAVKAHGNHFWGLFNILDYFKAIVIFMVPVVGSNLYFLEHFSRSVRLPNCELFCKKPL